VDKLCVSCPKEQCRLVKLRARVHYPQVGDGP
jgi:hypothetical protein